MKGKITQSDRFQCLKWSYLACKRNSWHEKINLNLLVDSVIIYDMINVGGVAELAIQNELDVCETSLENYHQY